MLRQGDVLPDRSKSIRETPAYRVHRENRTCVVRARESADGFLEQLQYGADAHETRLVYAMPDVEQAVSGGVLAHRRNRDPVARINVLELVGLR